MSQQPTQEIRKPSSDGFLGFGQLWDENPGICLILIALAGAAITTQAKRLGSFARSVASGELALPAEFHGYLVLGLILTPLLAVSFASTRAVKKV